MSNFLNSVKADLVDRRLLPIVVLVGIAFVAALAYAVLGGGSTAATPTAAVSPGAATPGSVAISQTTPEKAVAETTGGGSEQRSGAAHNPFTPLPETKAKSATPAATSAPTTSSSSAGSSSSSSSSSAGGGTGSSQGPGGSSPTPATPAKPSKPSTPSKPKTVYHVAVLFGALPAGTTPQTAQLTPFENLKLLTPLPSAKQPLIIFRGVTAGGKSATFTLVSEAILHGPAACLPSTTQCEAIDLRESQSEQLEYLSPAGVAELYELRIVNIVSSKASSAAIKSIYRGESKAGRELLGHAGLESIPDLRYSAQPGVLVFAVHRAFAARRRHGR
jgi:hypothetical protein